jgi:hypothetical protein
MALNITPAAPLATSAAPGIVELFSDTQQTADANTVTAKASRTYGIQLNSNGQAVVNVPLTPRVYTPTSPATTIASPLAPDISLYDQYCATGQTNDLTINAPTGTPANGDKLIFRIKADSTNRTVTLTTGSSGAFRAIGVTLPITVTASKITYIGCIYNAQELLWDVVAISQET